MAIQEIDYLFGVTPAGLKEYNDPSEAIQHRFENWITTPRGSFWGRPTWGHTLRKYLHDPASPTLAGVIELELAQTLTQDIPEVELIYVRVKEAFAEDGYSLKVGYRILTDTTGQVNEINTILEGYG